MEKTGIGFFTRIKKAIFKFEDYEELIIEPTKKTVGYFLKLMAIFALIIAITFIFKIDKESKLVLQVIDKEFPDFKISNNKLEVESEERFEYYFENLNFEVKMDQNIIEEDKVDYANSISLLKDKCVIKYNNFVQSLTYEELEIDNISKESILEYFSKNNWKTSYLSTGILIMLLSFISFTLLIILDVFTLFIIGLIINNIIRTAFKKRAIFAIAVYSMTLPILLYLLYIVANISFGVTIRYFEIGYRSISYIYLITVLLLMKSELIKNTQELQRIYEEQKRVREEIEREKQEEKERQEEEKRKKEREKQKEKEPKEEKEPKREPQAEN